MQFCLKLRTLLHIQIGGQLANFAYCIGGTDNVVFTNVTWKFFSLIQFRVRKAVAQSQSPVPFVYEGEPFFRSYNALYEVWVKRRSQRQVCESLNVSRKTLKQWEKNFADYGALGLLPELSYVQIEPDLERLIILIKSCRPHERSNLALRLAESLEIPGASLDIIRQVQRCYGYGQRMDERDIQYCHGLQHILVSVAKQKEKKSSMHDVKDRANTFYNFDRDHFQQRVELLKTLSDIPKKRQIRPVLKEFGMAPNRYYVLINRYMVYGIWGLVDLVQKGQIGEKISPELELQIIEERLMDPFLSTSKVIKKLNLKCSRANVQKIYKRWRLSRFKKQIPIRGVVSQPIPQRIEKGLSHI